MSEHKWEYVRTNSKGEPVFRKDTNESLEFVCEYLDSNNIDYEVELSASLIVVYSKADRPYMYYWTTGRWSPRKRNYKKHFHSNGIADFVEKYLNKYSDEHILEDAKDNEDSKTIS